MKKLNWKLPLLLLFICISFSAEAVKVEPIVEKPNMINNEITSLVNTNPSTIQTEPSKKVSQKQKRIKRKMHRLQKKWSKWSKKSKRFFGGATDNSKFRIGLLCLIGGLGLVILVNVISLGWVFGGLGELAAFVGVCLMIWGVLEYS